MDTMTTFLFIVAGIFLRLAIPIVVTAMFVFVLRRLDAHWQAEAEDEVEPLPMLKPECWKINDCPPEKVKTCAAAASPQPCWQVHRHANGYMDRKCLSCRVFVNAPAPYALVKGEIKR